MKATQRAQPKLPSVKRDAATTQSVKKKVDVEAGKKYAMATSTNKQFSLITNVLAKNAAKVKGTQKQLKDVKSTEYKRREQDKQNNVQNVTLPAIASSLNIVASSIQRINGILAKATGARSTPEDQPLAEPVSQPAPTATQPKALSLIQQIMSNPIFMVAALGLFWLGLDEDTKRKYKEFLGGFLEGLGWAMDDNDKKGLSALNTALKVVAGYFALSFGSSLIVSTVTAVIDMIKLARLLGGGRVGVGLAVIGAAGYGAYEGGKYAMGQLGLSGNGGSAVDSLGNISATGGTHNVGKEEAGTAAQVISFFMSKGWTREQAIGIAANLQAESSFKTNATGDSGKAYGIAQWHPDRQERFLQLYGKDIRNAGLEEQMEYVNWELNNTEKKAGNMLRGATSPEEAASLFDQYYERSSGAHRQKRMNIASAYASGITPDAVATTAPPSGNPPQRAAVDTQPTVTSGQPSSTMAKDIKDKSTSVAIMSEQKGDILIKKVSNKTVGEITDNKKGEEDSIPSPVANRGNLGMGTKFSTAYG